MAGLNIADKWKWVTGKLNPDGVAFAMPKGGVYDMLMAAINQTMAQVEEDAYSILLSMIPDNDTFSYADAVFWYRELGLYNGFTDDTHLAEMKAAIYQKQSFALAPLNMQSPAFIQAQLQAAGFPVYIYPNRFNTGGGITAINVDDGGQGGYAVDDPFSISTGLPLAYGKVDSIVAGTGAGLTLAITAMDGTGIVSWTIGAWGTGYVLHETFRLYDQTGTPPADAAVFRVTAVTAGVPSAIVLVHNSLDYVVDSLFNLTTDTSIYGRALSVTIVHPGAGYAVSTGVPTNEVAGYGLGLQVGILSVTPGPAFGTLTPGDILDTGTDASDLGAFDLGAQNLGGFWDGEIIANYLEPAKDARFGFTSNLQATFYISGGATIGAIATYANVPAIRQTEFRQLILKLKRCEAVGFMFVNYT